MQELEEQRKRALDAEQNRQIQAKIVEEQAGYIQRLESLVAEKTRAVMRNAQGFFSLIGQGLDGVLGFLFNPDESYSG